MSDKWIVSSHRFHEHAGFDDAERELVRLQTQFPKKNFRIYRVKSHLKATGTFPFLVNALDGLLTRYTQLAESGDAGFWDCEQEPEVIAARSALSRAKDTTR